MESANGAKQSSFQWKKLVANRQRTFKDKGGIVVSNNLFAKHSGVRGEGAGGASAPPKVLMC